MPDRTTNAAAAAKFVVRQRRRKPLGPDGRQAKARYCLREIGKGNVEILCNSEKVKVVSLNCKNDWRYLYKVVFPFSKWPSRQEVKMASRFLKYFGEKKKRSMLPAGPDWNAQWKGLVELDRRCQDTSREIQMLNERQEILRSKVSSERQAKQVKDCRTKIIE